MIKAKSLDKSYKFEYVLRTVLHKPFFNKRNIMTAPNLNEAQKLYSWSIRNYVIDPSDHQIYASFEDRTIITSKGLFGTTYGTKRFPILEYARSMLPIGAKFVSCGIDKGDSTAWNPNRFQIFYTLPETKPIEEPQTT